MYTDIYEYVSVDERERERQSERERERERSITSALSTRLLFEFS